MSKNQRFIAREKSFSEIHMIITYFFNSLFILLQSEYQVNFLKETPMITNYITAIVSSSNPVSLSPQIALLLVHPSMRK